MNTILFYYTGTGNSLWVAQSIAKELGDTTVLSITDFKEDPGIINGKRAGIVFPVHMWGVPHAVLRFIALLKGCEPDYFFAVAVNAGQVANTLIQLKKECLKQGIFLGTGFSIIMPSNYTPWGGPGPLEKQNALFNKAKEKAGWCARVANEMQVRHIEKGPLWQRIFYTWIYVLSFAHIRKMDRSFHVDDKCNSCAICQKVCPAGNITMDKGKPVWNRRCEQCFACLQWCPAKAIQYGKKTHLYERYHHPEIAIKDMLRK
jgi:Fe-S-cluster-containing hydrogenase component 2